MVSTQVDSIDEDSLWMSFLQVFHEPRAPVAEPRRAVHPVLSRLQLTPGQEAPSKVLSSDRSDHSPKSSRSRVPSLTSESSSTYLNPQTPEPERSTRTNPSSTDPIEIHKPPHQPQSRPPTHHTKRP